MKGKATGLSCLWIFFPAVRDGAYLHTGCPESETADPVLQYYYCGLHAVSCPPKLRLTNRKIGYGADTGRQNIFRVMRRKKRMRRQTTKCSEEDYI